jgi:hypothetical protein
VADKISIATGTRMAAAKAGSKSDLGFFWMSILKGFVWIWGEDLVD